MRNYSGKNVENYMYKLSKSCVISSTPTTLLYSKNEAARVKLRSLTHIIVKFLTQFYTQYFIGNNLLNSSYSHFPHSSIITTTKLI